MTESTDNQKLLRFEFHSFTLNDVDDVEIYAAQPIYEWQHTPPGKWVMEHANDVTWQKDNHFKFLGYRVTVYGYLEPKLAIEYLLRFGGSAP